MIATLLLLLPTCAVFVAAQSVHNVTVGVEGSFFNPTTVSARKGDLINFIFGGDIHTITQSSLGAPCTPLDGGFDSGLLGRGPQFDKPTQIFTLTVIDVSQPIWYYCAATRPYSHCTAGMVGAINPPSQDVFTSFLNSAKAIQNQTQYMPKVVTNGVGVTAAAPSTVADVFPTATQTGSDTPISTTHMAKPNNKAIIGGAVGGAAGLIALAALFAFLFVCMRKRRKSQRQQEHFHHDKHREFYNYNPQSPPLGHQQSFFSDSTQSNPMSPNRSPNYITAFDGAQHGNLSPGMMMQTQPLLRGNTASATSMATTKKPSMQLQPQRYSEKNAPPGPPMSQGQGTIYNEQPQGQDYEVAGMTPAPHDTSMGSRQDVNHPLPLPALHPLRLQPQQYPQGQHHHAGSSSVATSDSGDGINIKALAKEVAAVLKADSSAKSSKAKKIANQNPDSSSHSQDFILSHDRVKDSDSLRYENPPPKYHSDE